VAREGIEYCAESLLITAFLNNRKLSYPRCYPQLNLRKSATEPRTLGQFSAEPLSHCTVVFVQDGNGRSIWHIADDLNSPCTP
jgi:hypothetical protein